ncbi:MAG: pyruvate dehydrogenase complex dihydrolipoamide acetyltransferase [Rhodospirillales bacterium]|nr:pyruvate dehydrogenase complex dihydrolipoamide acetyltransferase [Rhodospirillales bacterium]
MPIPIRMPALSPTMTEGTLTRWLKKEGETVSSGDALAEIETDKATMEIEAADDGVLGRILVNAATPGVKVNDVIALLLAEGEDKAALDSAAKAQPQLAAKAPTPAAAAPAKAPAPAAAAPMPAKPQQAAPTSQPVRRNTPKSDGRIFASPLAKRLAAQAGVDLSQVQGSGPHGRILKRDIEQAPTGSRAVATRSAPMPERPHAIAFGDRAYADVPHTSMRKAIAKRLSESKRTIPHYYLTIDCEIDAMLALRKELNAKSPKGEGAYKLSVNDFVVRAVALSLRKMPNVNVSWGDDAMRFYKTVDVSVAVALPNGLITPIVRDADNKGLAAINGEVRDLAERARQGKLAPEEYEGGSFTISNLGMYGIKEFAAVINPPQSAILAIGAGEQRPVVKKGVLAIATVMSCTLSADHRAVDGAVGAEFMSHFRRLIEEPLTMLL